MALNKRIDFKFIIYADGCNPNGDPNTGNHPREDYEGFGEISDVCLKHKMRTYLHETGEDVLVLPTEETGKSILMSVKEFEFDKKLQKNKQKQDEFVKAVCEKWIDVRSFGMVFALKGGGTSSAVATGIRGAVSLSYATSIDNVVVTTETITKSVNFETEGKRESSTMGFRYMVNNAVYVCSGSIYPNVAEKTGFSDEDAEKIKQSIIHLFDFDVSSARPAGSMTLMELHWWTHPNKNGMYPPAKVHRSIEVEPTSTFPHYKSTEAYELEGLDHFIYKY